MTRPTHRPSNMFTATAQDLPLFSGTAPAANLDRYDPKPEAQQDSFIDRREYIAIFITDPTYFEGCRWIFDDPLNSGVTVEQLRNPCR